MDISRYSNPFPFSPGHTEAGKLYYVEDRRLYNLFKEDAIRECGLANHPKANQAFSMAWEDCHSDGLMNVYLKLEDLADLMLP